MKVIQLKLQSRFMTMKVLGIKRWELRVNDRRFIVGDLVHYKESARKPKTLAFR